ncbi:MAG TPA: cupin domain-containing protein [Phycisphaerae bacterium]|nr:cupin domain-containing protein [Phycisphaerae bacterium]
MIVKSIQNVPMNPVTMPGAQQATMQMLLGPQERCPNFAMRKFTVAPGGFTPHHQHDYEHEILVLAGEGTALSTQGPQALKAGDVVYVPANEMHQFQNTGKVNFEFICLVPSHVHQPKPCAG